MRKEEVFLQTLSTGISAQEGYENGYMQQLQGILITFLLFYRGKK